MTCPPLNTRTTIIRALLLGICLLTPISALHAAKKGPDPYYDKKPLFRSYPKSTGRFKVNNFGPVGIGIDLIGTNGGFKMVINNVEKGSPADATGKLKKKQVIKSINGQVMKERDPREILGDLITEAEATDGRIVLDIEGVGTLWSPSR